MWNGLVKNMFHEVIGPIQIFFCLRIISFAYCACISYCGFFVIIIPIVIYKYIYCSKLLNILCWWLLCTYWSLNSHRENILSFILSSWCINTCTGWYCGVIVGLYTGFYVGMWWYNNSPEAIAMIPFPFYHNFFLLCCVHLLFVEYYIATIFA